MPAFRSSLEENEETTDIYFVSNPVMLRKRLIVGMVQTRSKEWEIEDHSIYTKVRNWLTENVGTNADGKHLIYAWLPGSTTYDNIPTDKISELETILNGEDVTDEQSVI